MTQKQLPPWNELIRTRPPAMYLKKFSTLAESLMQRDPLANNPRMWITHPYSLIRPDDFLTADLLLHGLHKAYGVSEEHKNLFHYIHRVVHDYAVIEAHTHLLEPVSDLQKN